jgi:hypothetical protein
VAIVVGNRGVELGVAIAVSVVSLIYASSVSTGWALLVITVTSMVVVHL